MPAAAAGRRHYTKKSAHLRTRAKVLYNTGMRRFATIALCGAALCLSGCMTVDRAELPSGGGEHVFARNYGWKLFNCIPLVCGNASADATCGLVMFRNDVTMERVQAKIAECANGREIVCPVYHNYGKVFISFLGIPVPYLLCYNEVSVSATLRGAAR